MTVKKLSVLILLLLTGFPAILLADGKFYAPPETVPPGIPYQRAIIACDGNRELLILQSKYQGEAKDFGWVIPLPAVPELAVIERFSDAHLFLRAWLLTAPENIYLVDGVPYFLVVLAVALLYLSIKLLVLRLLHKPAGSLPKIAMLLFSILSVLLALFMISVTTGESGPGDIMYRAVLIACLGGLGLTLISRLVYILGQFKTPATLPVISRILTVAMFVISGFPLFITFVFPPSHGFGRALSKESSLGGVEVLHEQKVGIYSVKVVKAKESDDLVNWLKEQNYQFTEEDKQVFSDYIEKGWCFVTARIDLSEVRKTGLTDWEGMVRPLVMLFPTEETVYPLALTGTANTTTEILLYVFDSHKVSDPSGRFEMRYAGKEDLQQFLKRVKFEPVEFKGKCDIKSNYLTKLDATLSPQEMSDDLFLRHAGDNNPYREVFYYWTRPRNSRKK